MKNSARIDGPSSSIYKRASVQEGSTEMTAVVGGAVCRKPTTMSCRYSPALIGCELLDITPWSAKRSGTYNARVRFMVYIESHIRTIKGIWKPDIVDVMETLEMWLLTPRFSANSLILKDLGGFRYKNTPSTRIYRGRSNTTIGR